ncbi:MAG: HAD-IA family hydrolase [Acetobacteraceae bacterium]
MRRTILFDLDGTLVDTLPDLAASLNRIIVASRLPPFAPAEIAAMIGDGMPTLLARALEARCRPYDPALFARFEADYLAHVAVASEPYPGTVETLSALRDAGWRMAVATNKPEQAARQLLQALDLERFFKVIAGGDSFPVRKPDPGHLLGALRLAGGDAAHAAMLGDHANDVKSARAAGLRPIFALWGYGRREMADGAETVSTISAVPDLLETLVRPETAPPA